MAIRELRSRRAVRRLGSKGQKPGVTQEQALICREGRRLEWLKIHTFLDVCVEVSSKHWWMCNEIHPQYGRG